MDFILQFPFRNEEFDAVIVFTEGMKNMGRFIPITTIAADVEMTKILKDVCRDGPFPQDFEQP